MGPDSDRVEPRNCSRQFLAKASTNKLRYGGYGAIVATLVFLNHPNISLCLSQGFRIDE